MTDSTNLLFLLTQFIAPVLSAELDMPECKLAPSTVFISSTKVVPISKNIRYTTDKLIKLDFHLLHDCDDISQALEMYSQGLFECPEITMENLLYYGINSKYINFTINTISEDKVHTDLFVLPGASGDIDLSIFIRLSETQMSISGSNCDSEANCFNNCAGISTSVSEANADFKINLKISPESLPNSRFLGLSLIVFISFALSLAILLCFDMKFKFCLRRRRKDHIYSGLSTEASKEIPSEARLSSVQ